MRITLLFVVVAAIGLASMAREESPTSVQTEDVIYGRKYGMALTMDVFAPKSTPNGRGVIFVVSGGFVSSKDMIPGYRVLFQDLVDRGYVVFTVMHGCQPAFTIPEIIEDIHRSVRFIKHRAKDYAIDSDRLGIMGLSAGGHLSLMQGSAFKPGDPEASDKVERQSSRVAAVVSFFPPTDFLNYGRAGEVALGTGVLKDFPGAFDFREHNAYTNSFVPVSDAAKRLAIGRQISPLYHVNKDSAPTLIIHGDKDKLVPLQQSELMIAKFKEAGVRCELSVKKGAGHGWLGMENEAKIVGDWFDGTLRK
jgi:acetyl esterase/lipase